MNILEFIDTVLIDEINDIIPKHAYISFGLISQGIEFIGSCYDKFDFHEQNQSTNRFKTGLEQFDPKYSFFIIGSCNLYKNLRCGLLHVFIPKSEISLGEKQKDIKYNHLQKNKLNDGTERYVLLIEDFFADFKNALEKLKDNIKSGNIFKMYTVNKANQQKKDILLLKKDILKINL